MHALYASVLVERWRKVRDCGGRPGASIAVVVGVCAVEPSTWSAHRSPTQSFVTVVAVAPHAVLTAQSVCVAKQRQRRRIYRLSELRSLKLSYRNNALAARATHDSENISALALICH